VPGGALDSGAVAVPLALVVGRALVSPDGRGRSPV